MHQSAGMEQMLRVSEVAERLGVGERTVREWLRRGRLPRVDLAARAIRVPVSAVERLVREGLTPARSRNRFESNETEKDS
jgi:excisionase family DNA binding protein